MTPLDRKLLLREMSWEELITLRLYREDTYCINLTKDHIRDALVDKGYIEWVPAQAWSGNSTYAITQLGKEVRDALSNLSEDEKRTLRTRVARAEPSSRKRTRAGYS